MEIAKRGIIGYTLKLRIVHHEFHAGIGGHRSEDRDRFKQSPATAWLAQ
ncbi:MAG TPA: hypothetical protein VGE93_02895 [Bryobacteraceae bacterium]